MKEIQLPSGKYLLVEVESIFFNFRIGKSSINKGHLFASCHVTSGKKWELPDPGKWSIVGKASELTEEDWGNIIERWDSGMYNDYSRHLARVKEATISGLSLIKSHCMKPDQCLILKAE